MNIFHEGNLSFVNDDYNSAITKYTQALSIFEQQPQAEQNNIVSVLVCRSVANLKLKNFLLVLEDTNCVLQLDSQQERSYFRKG